MMREVFDRCPRNRWAFIVGATELSLLGQDPMITILSGLEVEVEVSALRIGGEEGGMLLGGHTEAFDRPLHFV
jgi:hypothetical protein